jgi:hypothetical protein
MLIGNVNREAERVPAGAALNCLAANQIGNVCILWVLVL